MVYYIVILEKALRKMMENLFNLNNRNILITGGTGYLGSAMCEGLAAYGANVIVSSRNYEKCSSLAERLSTDYKTRCKAVKMDITNADDIEQGINSIVNDLGSIDVLINNAYTGAKGYLEDFDSDTWNIGIDGSINGVFRVTQKVLAQMTSQKREHY